MNTEFKRYIINEISKMPFYHVSPNGVSHTIKCPYCNDDSPKHGHFGLKIDLESNDPILYHCFKCAAGGMVTPKVLNDINVSLPQDLAAQLYKSNKIYARKNNLTEVMIMPFEIPTVMQYAANPACVQMKINYIKDRIGLEVCYADAPAYRIIYSFTDFIFANKMENMIKISQKYLNFIDANYVGFLSLNKNCIIFRRVTNKGSTANGKYSSLRYIKFVIDEKNIDPDTFYTIPTAFDIMTKEPINVHISEGPFDILSIMANNITITESNNLFFAVCGFGYANVIKNVIKLGTCPINMFIYADNDKSDNEIKYQILSKKLGLYHYINDMTIIRNSYPNEKDFGVPINRIKPSYKKILIKR